MPNPLGITDLNPVPAEGAVIQARELAKQAPISGTPLPGSGTTQKPATVGGPAPAPAPVTALPYSQPPPGVEYYERLARTWAALARVDGASDTVKEFASQARVYANRVKKGQV